ncbi:MAG TPA: flagellar basal body L-ring protein FlgH [Ferrovibrio sp.]|uniref:flagellar basal body L-ring protein FlgH n=1 Tax=Ferrovibrio sp. TaxID=1917215 RepID=UPI002B4B2D55|nr:flagellar basal body L-ring protein FlgH [Ferrovibrio sp.]HLT76195.1 flagellar basal body L-ring protein FlgH [Ferrovibrio sp.]
MIRTLPPLRLLAIAGFAVSLGACGNLDRLAEIGQPPKMSKIDNPTERRDYRPVSLPMPAPEVQPRHANSLWRSGARQFFKDQRATKVGDILTVSVDLQDRAQVQNNTSTSRGNSESAGLPNFLGIETGALERIFSGITPSSAVGVESESQVQGQGQINRQEQIRVNVAALVTQVLPNGNLVVQGRQEIRVNNEIRELLVQGIVRPEDITATNVVNHTQMAEARISYGGRGQLSDVQQARWGQQIYDIIFPF